jgi:LAO/AO transport system kinase
VRTVSALEGAGVREVWDDVERFHAALDATGAWQRRRAEQARAALWAEIGDSLLDRFCAAPAVAARLALLEQQVLAGSRSPGAAARGLLDAFLGGAAEKRG